MTSCAEDEPSHCLLPQTKNIEQTTGLRNVIPILVLLTGWQTNSFSFTAVSVLFFELAIREPMTHEPMNMISLTLLPFLSHELGLGNLLSDLIVPRGQANSFSQALME